MLVGRAQREIGRRQNLARNATSRHVRVRESGIAAESCENGELAERNDLAANGAKFEGIWRIDLAERVGFVPVVPSRINDLGLIESPQSTKSTQNLSIRYKTGTAQPSGLKLSAPPGAITHLKSIPRSAAAFGPGCSTVAQ